MSSTQVVTVTESRRVFRRGRRASKPVRPGPKQDLIGPVPGLVSFRTYGFEEPAEPEVTAGSDMPETPASDDNSATSSADESDTQSSNNTSGYGTPPSEVDEPDERQKGELPPITIPSSHNRKASSEVSPTLWRRLSVYSPEKPTAAVTSPATASRAMSPLTIDDWGLGSTATRAQNALGGLIGIFHGSQTQVRGYSDDDEN